MVFDGLFGVLLFWGMVRGFKRGLFRQTLVISALVLAVMFADPLARNVSHLASRPLESVAESVRESLVALVSFALIFAAVLAGGSAYMSWYRNKVVGDSGPSFGDRLFGAGFGLAVGTLWVAGFVWLHDRLPTSITELPLVRTQAEQSRGMEIGRQYKLGDRIADAPEVQRLKDHLVRVVYHFRSKPDTRPDAKPAPEAKPSLPLPAAAETGKVKIPDLPLID